MMVSENFGETLLVSGIYSFISFNHIIDHRVFVPKLVTVKTYFIF